MGAHPAAPSRLHRASGPEPLDAVIRARPSAELGEATPRRFGPRLPFLLKLLAVGAPLSLQVHPDLAQAAVGHRIENARGVPLDAPHRNYRDGNHEPEMVVALSAFEGLCGFRPPPSCADLLETLGLPELAPHARALREEPEEAALEAVFPAFLAAPASLAEAVATQRTRLPGSGAEGLRLCPGGAPDRPGRGRSLPGDRRRWYAWSEEGIALRARIRSAGELNRFGSNGFPRGADEHGNARRHSAALSADFRETVDSVIRPGSDRSRKRHRVVPRPRFRRMHPALLVQDRAPLLRRRTGTDTRTHSARSIVSHASVAPCQHRRGSAPGGAGKGAGAGPGGRHAGEGRRAKGS